MLLLLKLAYSVSVPWIIVALPVWASLVTEVRDVAARAKQQSADYAHRTQAAESSDVRSVSATTGNRTPFERRERLMLLSDALVIGCVGCTVLFIVPKLSGSLPDSIPWLAVLSPLWVQGKFASTTC